MKPKLVKIVGNGQGSYRNGVIYSVSEPLAKKAVEVLKWATYEQTPKPAKTKE